MPDDRKKHIEIAKEALEHAEKALRLSDYLSVHETDKWARSSMLAYDLVNQLKSNLYSLENSIEIDH